MLKNCSADFTAAYDGPVLKPGMIGQFRATSLSGDGVPLFTTEDLRGMFVYK